MTADVSKHNQNGCVRTWNRTPQRGRGQGSRSHIISARRPRPTSARRSGFPGKSRDVCEERDVNDLQSVRRLDLKGKTAADFLMVVESLSMTLLEVHLRVTQVYSVLGKVIRTLYDFCLSAPAPFPPKPVQSSQCVGRAVTTAHIEDSIIRRSSISCF